jgi:hypothetical protein
MPCRPHQREKSAPAWAYALRVFVFRMCAVKNSTVRRLASASGA